MKNSYSYYAKLLVLFYSIFLVSNTYSQNYNDALRLGIPGLGSNARALGMGDSYIGLSDDDGAATFNPAGWALTKKLSISGGLGFDNFGNNTTFFGQSTNYSSTATRLNDLSFTLPFPTVRGSLVFAITYHTTKDLTSTLKFNGFNNGNNSFIQDLNSSTNIPYDLYLTDTNFVTPINGHLKQSGSILTSGELHDWTFSGAIEAYKNLFVGINLNFSSGSYNSNNNYYEDDTHNLYTSDTDPGNNNTYDFQTFYLNRILNWDISGWNAKFGVLYQIQDKARLGITVQFPKTYTVKETYDVNGYSQFANYTYNLDPTKYSDQVQYDIVTPYELSFGGSANFASLIVSAQATLIDYSQMQFQNASGLSTDYVNQANQQIKNVLRSVFNYNLGAEYTFPVIGVRLRAGYMVMPSAFQSDASTSNYDRKYVTFGVGYLAQGAVGFDLAYAHGFWKNFGDNYGTDVSRTFQNITKDKLILSMTYRF